MFQETFLGALGIFGAIILPILAGLLMVMLILKHLARRNQMEHEERMLAIEKGVAIPPKAAFNGRRRNPYVWGFVLFGLGLGFVVAKLIEGSQHLMFGLLMLCAGAALLIANGLFLRYHKARPLAAAEPGAETIGTVSGEAELR